jgi:hypothetical protein
MKIIITESQEKQLFNRNIKCQCGHSWKMEKKDKHPFLCHWCGWDQRQEKYNDKELLNFWKKELM